MTYSEKPDPNGDLCQDLSSCSPRYSGPPEYLREMLSTFATLPKHNSDLTSIADGHMKTWQRFAVGIVVGSFAILGVLLYGLVNARNQVAAQQHAISFLEPTSEECADGLLVNFVRSADLTDTPGPNELVTVSVKNVVFPCQLLWKLDDAEPLIKQLPSGDSQFRLPRGSPVTVYCRPIHTGGWFQIVQTLVRRNGNLQAEGSSLGKYSLKLQSDDEVIVYFEQPTPPWNAVCVPIKSEWMMVTLERPMASYDADKWLTGQWDANERFPNTALFWAEQQSSGLAKELAGQFFKNRDAPGRFGRFRGAFHTSVVVRGDENSVSPIMQAVTQQELEMSLLEAFELLRKKTAPTGELIEKQIEAASDLLKRKP